MSTSPDTALITSIRTALRDAADPGKAAAMQAYMKSEMPFLGVQKPARNAALHPLLDGYQPTRATWAATVRALWDEAGHREERYAALSLLDIKTALPWHDIAALDLFRYIITTGAWWDYVDEIAIHHVRTVLLTHRGEASALLRQWSIDDDRWLRRTAVIAQIGTRGGLDRALLTEAIDANAADPDFFLRKAIGWALRDVAWRDPDWVRAFVASRELSALSRREALRNIGASKPLVTGG